MIKDWKYKGKFLKEIPEGYIGFVYLIKNEVTGYIYVGKKFFEHTNKRLLTKKDKLLPENKRKKFKYVVSDSGWRDYFGSAKSLHEDMKVYGKENFSRTVLHLCTEKRELTYLEVKEQFNYNVLECDSYNENIMGKFFKSKKQ